MSDKYLVLLMKDKLEAESFQFGYELKDGKPAPGTVEIPCQWAVGQVGALPVFDDWNAAFDYAGDASLIVTIRASNHGH